MPDSCLIEKISIDADSVAINSIEKSQLPQIYFNKAKTRALFVNDITIDITMDEKVEIRTRDQIERILSAKTRFIEPVRFNLNVTMFPESLYDRKIMKSLSKIIRPRT